MSGRLVYSRSHMDTKVHRQIPVSQILDAIEFEPNSPLPTIRRPLSTTGLTSPNSTTQSTAGEEGGRKNYQHTFKIITPKRTFLVCAPNEEEEIKWLAALHVLVARRSINSSTSTGNGAGLGRSLSLAGTGIQNKAINKGRARSMTIEGKEVVEGISRRFHP